MTWFRVDDHLHDHRKIRKLGKDRLPAVGLWSLCGSWAGATLSDGFIPAEIVQRYDPPERYAKRLVEVGLWVETEHDGESGYRYHQWGDHQPTRDEVEERRQRRAAAGRLGGQATSQARAKASGVASATANARPNAAAGASGPAKANGSSKVQPRPDPSRTSSSSSSPSEQSPLADLGVTDDDETTKILDLVQQRFKPTAMGPYLRKLAENGDLPLLLAEVRAAKTAGQAASNGYTGPTHAWNVDPTGNCAECPLPEVHPCHRVAAPASLHLIAGGTA